MYMQSTAVLVRDFRVATHNLATFVPVQACMLHRAVRAPAGATDATRRRPDPRSIAIPGTCLAAAS